MKKHELKSRMSIERSRSGYIMKYRNNQFVWHCHTNDSHLYDNWDEMTLREMKAWRSHIIQNAHKKFREYHPGMNPRLDINYNLLTP
jgi:hypothetical protein